MSLINYGSFIIQRSPLPTYDNSNGLQFPTNASLSPIQNGTDFNDTCVYYNQNCSDCQCRAAKNVSPEASLFNGATCAFYTTASNSEQNNACKHDDEYTLLCAQACKTSCPLSSSTNTNLRPVKGYTARTPVLQQSMVNRCGENHGTDKLEPCETQKNHNMFQQCIYDTSLFDAASIDDLASFRNNPNASGYGRNYDDIMVHWCAGKITKNSANSCPPNPITGQTDSNCPRMKSSGDEFKQCNQWITSKNGLGLQLQYLDAVGSLYCSLPENKTNGACMCVNRSYNSDYLLSKQTAPYNDGCWFKPCIPSYKPDYFFIPSECQTSLNSSICPSDVCENIINLSGSNTTVIDNNKIYTNCNY